MKRFVWQGIAANPISQCCFLIANDSIFFSYVKPINMAVSILINHAPSENFWDLTLSKTSSPASGRINGHFVVPWVSSA